jgi:hypothetical protein
LVCCLLGAVIRWPGCLPEGNGKVAFANDLQFEDRVPYVLYFVPSLDTAHNYEKGYSDFVIVGSTVGVKTNLDSDVSTAKVQLKSIKKNPTRCNNVSKFYYSIFI